MSLDVIQGLWTGRPLSTLERLSVRSFLANGHPVALFCYDQLGNVPEGVELRDARDIMPQDDVFVDAAGFFKGTYVGFSDVFRMHLMEKVGGWWVDLDVVCLRPFVFDQLNLVASSDEREWGVLANPNVMKLERGHPLAGQCLAWFAANANTFGPAAIQAVVKEHHYEDLLVAPEVFNPIQWRYTRYLLRPKEPWWHPREIKRRLGVTEQVGEIGPATRGLHLWSMIWTQNQWDRDAAYHPRSEIEKLKRRYL